MMYFIYLYIMGLDSSVGIATCPGMDGPEIESRWVGRDFPHPVQTGPGAHPAPCTMGTGSFLEVKRPGRCADHPPSPKCRGHERVGLYLYSPSGPQWPVIGRTLYIFNPNILRSTVQYNVEKDKQVQSAVQPPFHRQCVYIDTRTHIQLTNNSDTLFVLPSLSIFTLPGGMLQNTHMSQNYASGHYTHNRWAEVRTILTGRYISMQFA